MKRAHHAKSPKGKGFQRTSGDKRRRSGSKGTSSTETTPNRRNRSKSGGFQEFGNFLWTFDETTNHWIAKESADGEAASSHSKSAMRELSEFGSEFPPRKGKKGKGPQPNSGTRKASKAPVADKEDAEDPFVGFRRVASDHSPYKSSSPVAVSGSTPSSAVRFVRGETLHDTRKSDKANTTLEKKEEAVEPQVLEIYEDRTPSCPTGGNHHARPLRWQSEPAIPKYVPVVSPSEALQTTPAPLQRQNFSGRGRGRGRARPGDLSASPSSPADFHYAYEPAEDGAAKGDMAVEGGITETPQAVADASNPNQTSDGQPSKSSQSKSCKKKNNTKAKNRQLKNKHAFESMESDSALFTTRDLVRGKMQAGLFNKQRTKSSEEDEENAQADEDFLFGRGGRETRKGAPVKRTPQGKKKHNKDGSKRAITLYDDSDDDEMDEEFIRDYILNTDMAELSLADEELDEQLLLHIVSQLNEYRLSDEEDDDDDDDEESDDDEDDSDDIDTEEDFYDDFGDDEDEDEKEGAKNNAVVSSRPPSFRQRLQRQQQQRRQQLHRQRQSGGRKQTWKTDRRIDEDDEIITDEEELPYIDRTRLKSKPRSPSGPMVTLHSINEAIGNFIDNKEKEWLELPPMSKKQRAHVHQLASIYKLDSKSYGKGTHRFATLVKTIHSCHPPQSEIVCFLDYAVKVKVTPAQPKAGREVTPKKSRKFKQNPHRMRKRSYKDTVVSVKREMDGKVVGEGASPVGESTIGSRLLQAMGWNGGGLVGSNGEGIAEPLVAVVKNNRRGLGF